MRSITVVSSLLVLLAAGCGGGAKSTKADPPPAAAPDKTLFERLGGMPAIEAVVKDFLGNVGADARINGRFAGTDLGHLEKMLDEQVCAATGGPCTYTGKSMAAAHAGMKVTDVEFDALVEDLAKSLDKFSVPAREKGELLGALGGMKSDIVGK